jgi:hypothetical protein
LTSWVLVASSDAGWISAMRPRAPGRSRRDGRARSRRLSGGPRRSRDLCLEAECRAGFQDEEWLPGSAVSPTLASLAVMTPANGARRTVRSAMELASASLAWARLHCDIVASYCATESTCCSFQDRGPIALALGERGHRTVCSRRASTSRAESLTRTSPERTELPRRTRTSATVPLSSGAMSRCESHGRSRPPRSEPPWGPGRPFRRGRPWEVGGVLAGAGALRHKRRARPAARATCGGGEVSARCARGRGQSVG